MRAAQGLEARGEQPGAWRLGTSSRGPGGPGRAAGGLEAPGRAEHYPFCAPYPSELPGEFLSREPRAWRVFVFV